MAEVGHGWYPGDIVQGPGMARGILRVRDGERAKVQIGPDWTWVWLSDLTFTGEALGQVPRTELGWRQVGERVALGLL